MKDEELLSRIRDHLHEERADDARWEAVARGDVDPAELADLERRAADDPHVAAMLEAARPLGEAAAERIAKRLLARGDDTKKDDTKKVVPFRRRVAVVALPLALAAAVLLGVGLRSRGGEELPPYAVTAVGEQAMRGPGDGAASRLHLRGGPDARFTIVARPAHPVAARMSAYAFAVRGAEVAPVDATLEVADEGAVRVVGAAHALDGASEVRIIVGALDADAALRRAQSGRGDAHVAAITVAIDRD